MKKNSLLLILLGILLFTACSSTPDITGRWQADNWDCDFIEFTVDQKYYKYKDSGNSENLESFDNGMVSHTKQEGHDCLVLGSQVIMDGSWALTQSFSYEKVSENQITLYTDKEQKNDQCLDISAEEDLVKLDLKRVE